MPLPLFEGLRREKLSPVGGNRQGVMRFSEFLLAKTGREDGELDLYDWLTLPEQNLLEVTAGKIYSDPSGFVTKICEELKQLPEEIRLKKLAGKPVKVKRFKDTCNAPDGNDNEWRDVSIYYGGFEIIAVYHVTTGEYYVDFYWPCS